MLPHYVCELQNSIGDLSEFIKWRDRTQKEAEAKRAIELLQKEGFSFEQVTFGNFRFVESRFGKAEYVPQADDDGIPF